MEDLVSRMPQGGGEAAAVTAEAGTEPSPGPTCRFCAGALPEPFLDLGVSPLANAFVRPEDLGRPETFYPLRLHLCPGCRLVQLPELASPEVIFSDYAYFSSFSESWLAHCREFAAMAAERFSLGRESRVVEVASNDGYLLRWFAEAGVPVLGIEPAANVAAAAEELGVPTLRRFFGVELARELAGRDRQADLLVANNVLAHVPDLNDFVAGIAALLRPEGVATAEFPHLLNLLRETQFDTIYHEHFSYFSLKVVQRVLEAHGLTLFDVDEIPTHGGSLRIYARHAEAPDGEAVSPRVAEIAAREEEAGLSSAATYRRFAGRVAEVKADLLRFLLDARAEGRTVVGYGAPAKGNTLLNFCGVRPDLLPYTVDRSPHKQGLYLPGTRIPIHAPDRIRETRPGTVLILPWNLRQEIAAQMADVASWGGRFAVAVPRLEVFG